MSTIRKRGKKYQVQIRLEGQKKTKTFNHLKLAKKWSIYYENKILLGNHLQTLNKNLSLRDLINKYLKEITPLKKGKDREQQRLSRLLKEDLVNHKVYKLNTKDFIEFKNIRIKDGNRTCRYDLALLHHIYNTAIKQWCYPITHNPLSNIPKPKCNPPRERRLKPGEYERLKIASSETKVWYLWPIIDFAIETGMRRSEILNMKWEHLGLDNKRVLLPMTKNGSSRWVPLSEKAIKILKNVPSSTEHVFPITDVALRQSWERLRNRANLIDFTFHDLRHEAISRMFEKGLNVPEVASISGHKTASQLFRYVQIKGKL